MKKLTIIEAVENGMFDACAECGCDVKTNDEGHIYCYVCGNDNVDRDYRSFRAIKDVTWDNCMGGYSTVAREGDIMSGYLVSPFNPERPWEYAVIEVLYMGEWVSDYASKEEVEAIG